MKSTYEKGGSGYYYLAWQSEQVFILKQLDDIFKMKSTYA